MVKTQKTIYWAPKVGAAAILLLLGTVQVARAGDSVSPTATEDQRYIETLALKLAQKPEIKRARAEAKRQFLADPAAKIPAGAKTLDGALDEMVYQSVSAVAGSDLSQPRVQWVEIADHEWFGLKVPGDRVALDNPDNIYRNITIDGQSKYKIAGKLASSPAIQYSFIVYGSAPDEAARINSIDTPIASILNTDLKPNPDGTFEITVDSEPANGRINHLQTNQYANKILLRDTLGDWSKQTASAIRVERVGGPAIAESVSEDELTKRAVEEIAKQVPYWLKFNNSYLYQLPPNHFAKVTARGGGWGFMAQGQFDLKADEALVVTVDTLGAKYIGFQIGDPWLRSREYRHQSSSLNTSQAKPNSDGSYTYVIAAKDPGFYNWLDTDGLGQGAMLIRWQALTKKLDKADGVIKQLQKIKIAELEQRLPNDVARVTSEERKLQLAQRLASYQLRLQTP